MNYIWFDHISVVPCTVQLARVVSQVESQLEILLKLICRHKRQIETKTLVGES